MLNTSLTPSRKWVQSGSVNHFPLVFLLGTEQFYLTLNYFIPAAFRGTKLWATHRRPYCPFFPYPITRWASSSLIALHSHCILFFNSYFREHEWGRGREREFQAGSMLTTKHDAGLNPMTPGSFFFVFFFVFFCFFFYFGLLFFKQIIQNGRKIGYLQKISNMYREEQIWWQKRLKYMLASQKHFSKSLILFSWILRMSKILLHLWSWEPNSTLNVSYQQFYTLQQRVPLQTYWMLL